MPVKRKQLLVYILVTLLLPCMALAEDQEIPPGLAAEQIVGEVVPDDPPLIAAIPKGIRGANWLSQKWSLRYDRCVAYKLNIKKQHNYTVSLLCERESPLGLALVSRTGRILGVARADDRRNYRRLLITDINAPSTNYLLVGSATTDEPIKFALQVSSGGKKARLVKTRQNPVLKEGHTKGAISEKSLWFQCQMANYYDLSQKRSAGRWIRIRVESDEFDTFILILDEEGDTLATNDDMSSICKDSELVVPPEKRPWLLVVMSYEKLKPRDVKKKSYPYTITVKSFPYDPNKGLLGAVTYTIGKPINCFLLGVVVSILIAWVYHKKGLQVRCLLYDEVLDHTLIAEPGGPDSLKVTVEGRELDHASLYKFRFENAGHARITGDMVTEPVSVTLRNVVKIVDIAWSQRGSGWRPPKLVADATVELEFEYLDRGDFIELATICEHSCEAQSMRIEPHVKGEISETSLRSKQHKASLLIELVVWLGVMFFYVTLPMVLLDVRFRFMPKWWPYFYTKVGPWFVGAITAYYLLTRRGRREFMEALYRISPILKGIFQKRRAEPASAQRHRLSQVQVPSPSGVGDQPQREDALDEK